MDDLRFLHSPKTAGSTFANILIGQYGLRSHFQFIGTLDRVRDRWNSLPRKKQDRTHLFLCHSPLVTGIEKADQARLITFLRDPVNRVKSFCQHVYEGKSPYLKDKFPPASFSLDAFLDSGELELDNLQVNILAGNAGGGSRKVPYGLKGEKLLETAWTVLKQQVDSFGLLEEFDPSILLFKEQLGWPKDPFYVRVNKKSTSRQLDFKQHHLDRIVELNRLDIELYNRVGQLFRERVKRKLTSEKINRFQQENRTNQILTQLKWFYLRCILKLDRMASGST